MTYTKAVAGAFVTAGLLSMAPGSSAQTVLEQAAEHRFQLDFHVNDAALAKMLPAGMGSGHRDARPGEGRQPANDLHRSHGDHRRRRQARARGPPHGSSISPSR